MEHQISIGRRVQIERLYRELWSARIGRRIERLRCDQVTAPSFLHWRHRDVIRLTDYVRRSAFRDHRFDPIMAKDFKLLQCGWVPNLRKSLNRLQYRFQSADTSPGSTSQRFTLDELWRVHRLLGLDSRHSWDLCAIPEPLAFLPLSSSELILIVRTFNRIYSFHRFFRCLIFNSCFLSFPLVFTSAFTLSTSLSEPETTQDGLACDIPPWRSDGTGMVEGGCRKCCDQESGIQGKCHGGIEKTVQGQSVSE